MLQHTAAFTAPQHPPNNAIIRITFINLTPHCTSEGQKEQITKNSSVFEIDQALQC